MNTIKDVVLDAEERQIESHAVQGWLVRLKIALYAADDLFDEFATMVLQRQVMGSNNMSREVINFFSHSNRIAFAFNISRKIKKIREELDAIVKDSSEFAFVLPPREEGKLIGQLRNQSHSFVDVEQVIGREEDRQAIIDILLASCSAQAPRLSVLPIVGIGGLGKTTLAQLLYNDDRVNDLFELKLWVCVSETFDLKEVIKKILMSATNNESQNLEEKSWALFEKMAFENGESQNNPRLVKLGKEIVEKCAAGPLALRTLGTLLRGNDERKWISIAGTSFADTQNNVMAILKLSYHHLLSPLKNCFAYCALFPKDYIFQKETLVDLWMAENFVISANETQSLKEIGDEYVMLLLQRCFFQDVMRDEWGDISSFKMHDLMHDLALEVAGTESKTAKFQDRGFSDRIRHLSLGYQLTGLWEIPSCMLKAKLLRTFLLPEQVRDGLDFNKSILQQLISNFRCLRVLDLRNLGFKILPKSIGKLIHLRYLNLSLNPIEVLPHSITRLQNLQTLILYRCPRLRALPILTRKLTSLRSLNVFDCLSLTHLPPGLGGLTFLHKLPFYMVKGHVASKFLSSPATAHLRDLKTLNNIRGSLQIKFCDDLENPASEAKEANLSSKHGLTELFIHLRGKLYEDVSSNSSNHDEAILEGLKPHQNLKKLVVYWFRGEKLPSWAMTNSLCMTLPNLVEIRLLGCGRCQQVPSFRQLPFLRCLSLVYLESVEYMERSLHGLQSCEAFYPSLQELELVGMNNLKGWWEAILDQSSHHHLLSLSFPCLTKLRIKDCTNLASFPLSPNVEELILKNVNTNLTVLKKLTSSVVGTTSEYSSKLKTLSVDEVEDLISLPEECLGHITSLEIQDTMLLNTSRLEDVFKRLSSLNCLMFTDCKCLTSISKGMHHLTSLESLVLENCEELDLSLNEPLEDGIPWKALKSIRSLHFNNIPKMVHLPGGLQHLTELRALKISFNHNLVDLPEWIGCFSSLEYMHLRCCLKLTCLPEELGKLTTLNTLEIMECPVLITRCRYPTRSDWHKIQHVPVLVLTNRE